MKSNIPLYILRHIPLKLYGFRRLSCSWYAGSRPLNKLQVTGQAGFVASARSIRPDTLLPVADVIYTGIVLACTRWNSGQCIVIVDSTLNP